jgi:hypothetical protein
MRFTVRYDRDGIIANSVCWWSHPLGTPQLMEIAVVGSVSPLVCVCVLVVCVLPCPEFIIAALLGNWLPVPRLDRSRLRSLSASPVIAATNAWPTATQTLVRRHKLYCPLRADGLRQCHRLDRIEIQSFRVVWAPMNASWMSRALVEAVIKTWSFNPSSKSPVFWLHRCRHRKPLTDEKR